MNQTKPRLDKDLHLRLDEQFQNQLVQIAHENNLKPSTFARIVLQRNVPQYTRNRFFG
jgi:antitoxin component of RelBE/YafQ-DinJ toxin-antitoxin module